MRIWRIERRVPIYAWNTLLKSIIVLLVLYASTISISSASESTVITILPENQTIYPGNTINISLNCSTQQPIKAFQFDLSFNPKLLQVTKVTEGNFFEGYLTFFNAGTINNDIGMITNIYSLILGLGNVTKTGTFVSVNFTAKSASGNSIFTLLNLNVTNEEAVPIPVQVITTRVTVIGPRNSPSSSQNQPPSSPMKPLGQTLLELGVPYVYNSSAVDPDNDRVRLRFDWGDGSMSNWTENVSSNELVSLSHTWLTVSNYTIRVIAQDENAMNSSWSDPITVIVSRRTSADFVFPLDVNANQTVIFNASGSYAVDSVIVSYKWNFGDGVNGTGKTPVHIYQFPGEYNVTLSIINEFGMIYNKTQLVIVSAMTVPNEKNSAVSFSPVTLTLIIIFGMILSVLVIFRDRIGKFLVQRSIDASRRRLAQFDRGSTTLEEILDSVFVDIGKKTMRLSLYNLLEAYSGLINNYVENKDGFRQHNQSNDKIERIVDDRLHAMIIEKLDMI
jgi:PKD repeat protein